jgi:hypothetical protein
MSPLLGIFDFVHRFFISSSTPPVYRIGGRFLLGIRCASRCVLGGAPDKTPCTSVLRGKVKGTELSFQWTQALTALFELSFLIQRK